VEVSAFVAVLYARTVLLFVKCMERGDGGRVGSGGGLLTWGAEILLRKPMLRLCLGLISGGAAVWFACNAYWCWTVRRAVRSCGRNGAKAEIFGVTLPFPLGMALLVALFLTFAFVGMYALFLPG
jgi:hypothetical protein